MSIETGRVVKAVAGHDAQGLFAVISSGEGYVLLADGRRRTLEKPKRKSVRHVRKTKTVLELSSITTNKHLREALRAITQDEGGSSLV